MKIVRRGWGMMIMYFQSPNTWKNFIIYRELRVKKLTRNNGVLKRVLFRKIHILFPHHCQWLWFGIVNVPPIKSTESYLDLSVTDASPPSWKFEKMLYKNKNVWRDGDKGVMSRDRKKERRVWMKMVMYKKKKLKLPASPNCVMQNRTVRNRKIWTLAIEWSMCIRERLWFNQNVLR